MVKIAKINEVDYEGFSDHVIVCNKYGMPHHALPIEDFFNKVFREPCPDVFAAKANAIFAVSRKRILDRSLDFYENLLTAIVNEPYGPYIVERLWQVVFGGPEELKNPKLMSIPAVKSLLVHVPLCTNRTVAQNLDGKPSPT